MLIYSVLKILTPREGLDSEWLHSASHIIVGWVPGPDTAIFYINLYLETIEINATFMELGDG